VEFQPLYLYQLQYGVLDAKQLMPQAVVAMSQKQVVYQNVAKLAYDQSSKGRLAKMWITLWPWCCGFESLQDMFNIRHIF